MKFSLLKFLALGLCGISSVNAVNKSEIICSYIKKIEVPADTKLDYCTVIENENGLNLLLRYEADKSLADIFSQTFVFNDQNIMPETRKLFCRIFRDNEDITVLSREHITGTELYLKRKSPGMPAEISDLMPAGPPRIIF